MAGLSVLWAACVSVGLHVLPVAAAAGMAVLWPVASAQLLLVRFAGRWRWLAAVALSAAGCAAAVAAGFPWPASLALATLSVADTMAVAALFAGRDADGLRDVRELVRGTGLAALLCVGAGLVAALIVGRGALVPAYALIWAVMRVSSLAVWLPLLTYRERTQPAGHARDLRWIALLGIAAVPLAFGAGWWLRVSPALIAGMLTPVAFLTLAVLGIRGALAVVALILVVGLPTIAVNPGSGILTLMTFELVAAGLMLSLLIMRGTFAPDRATSEAPVLDAISAEVQEALVRLDNAGTIQSANDAFGKLSDVDTGVIGMPLTRFVQEEHRGALETAIASLAAGERVEALELVFVSSAAEPQWVELVLARLQGGQGIGGAMRDISVRRRHNDALERARRVLEVEVERDPLTHLANRRLFDRRLAEAVADAEAGGGTLVLVLFDVDHFKQVNDTLGHGAGDDVLRRLGEAARGMVRSHDLVARLGGDEFAMILPGTTASIAERIANRLLSQIATSFDDVPIAVSVSLGVGAFGPGSTAISLFESADRALYRAKAAGRATVAVDD